MRRGYTGRRMPGRTRVPRPTVDRLSLYLRELERLETQDRGTVSSRQLGTAAGAAEAQVRKDLGIIGHTGQAGIGYSVPLLAEAIRQVIGVHRQWRAALVGAGNVGRALAAYRRFREEGFEIVAAFDMDPIRAREKTTKITVLGMDKLGDFVLKNHVRMAIVAVPAVGAQEVINDLVENGVVGILNFAPIVPHVPENVMVNNVNLAIELENLSYFIQG